jgi:hypothetical protein
MKKITAETTYCIMDAIAYAITIMCASENPTAAEVDELSRAITTLYCHEEEDEDEDEEEEENPIVKAMCEILDKYDYFAG